MLSLQVWLAQLEGVEYSFVGRPTIMAQRSDNRWYRVASHAFTLIIGTGYATLRRNRVHHYRPFPQLASYAERGLAVIPRFRP
jgi:hypothetical protein